MGPLIVVRDMSDSASPGPPAMSWVFAVREFDPGLPPFAEAIMEVAPDDHSRLLQDALDSGFALAIGDPPPATAELQLTDGRLTAVTLVGGHYVVRLGHPVQLSPAWLAAARERGTAIVVVVPPGTLPGDELDETARADALTTRLDKARAAGRVLHGAARVSET